MRKDTERGRHGLVGGTVSALLMLTVCILGGWSIFSLYCVLGGGGGFFLVQGLLLAALAVGVLIALVQRWREVADGEEEEAKKY